MYLIQAGEVKKDKDSGEKEGRQKAEKR